MVDWKSQLEKAAVRKEKREEKRKSLPWAVKSNLNAKGQNLIAGPQKRKKRKPTRISARRQAFNRLQSNCKKYVLLRAKKRTFGYCEVGVACHGYGNIDVWYHIFPQADGNALKYDERNIVGACHACNRGEYNFRKSVDTKYHLRHRQILGNTLFEALDIQRGRRQISTVEANQMADRFHLLFEDLNEERN